MTIRIVTFDDFSISMTCVIFVADIDKDDFYCLEKRVSTQFVSSNEIHSYMLMASGKLYSFG